MSEEVTQVFATYSPRVRDSLLLIRQWIVELAQADEQIGQVKECLKWNEVSYLTVASNSGTTLRLTEIGGEHHDFALLVHCQTRLISEFKTLYPQLNYAKNRAVIFSANQPLPEAMIKHFIVLALTYHRWK